MATILKAKDRVNLRSIGFGSVLPAPQTIARIGIDTYIVVDIKPSANTTALSNGDILRFDLEPNIVYNIKNMVLRFRIQCANSAVTTVPGPYFIDRMRIIANKGTGDILMDIYPENILFGYCLMEERERDFYEQNGHLRFTNRRHQVKLRPPLAIQVGEVKEVYIPIPFSFWDMDAIMMQHIREEIRLEIQLNNDFVVSGTATNITVTSVSLLIRQDDLSARESSSWVSEQKMTEHQYNYLDCIKLTDNTKNLQASVSTKFDLQNIVGKCPFLVVIHKGSTAPQASDESLYDFYEIGESATFDLKSPANESLLGKGNAIRVDYLHYLWTKQVHNKPIMGLYLIPFCNDIPSSIQGIIDNYYQFQGNKDSLEITYDAAGQSEIHAINLSGTSASGNAKVGIAGYYTSGLVYTSTAATVATAFNALRPVESLKLTAAFTATPLTTASTGTITFDANRDGRVSQDLATSSVISESLATVAPAPVTVTETVSQYGRIGWLTSSSREVTILAYYVKRLTVNQGGRLSCKTL